MRPPKIFKRLTPLVIAAILLSFAAPASEAQRRRSRTRTRAAQRARRHTPRTNPARTQAPTTPSVVSTQPAASGAQPSNPDNASAPRATDETGADERRGPQDERTFEEMVGADTYGAYVELRRVGTLGQSNELKTALVGLKFFGDVETKPVTDLIEFVSSNHEPLAEARFVMLFMAARPRVPLAVSAVEFPTAQDAAAFEPRYRQFADEQLKIYREKYPEPKDSTERRPSRRGGRAQPKPEAKQTPFDFTLKRIGRVLISAEKGLSLKRLRGEESAPSLADSSRFQNARTRFSSDSLFVYVDTGVTMQGYTRLGQEAAAGGVDTTAGRVGVETVGVAGEPEIAVIAPTSTPLEVATAPAESATPEPEEMEGDEESELTEEQRKALAAELAAEAEANKPSEEQLAVSGMGSVMRSLWGGMPRIPGAFALGVRLDNGAVVLRLAVENSNDGKVSIIPFLPNFVAGPPVTAAAAEVAPADADIFVTTSLDWEQVYVSTLGTAAMAPTMASLSRTTDGESAADDKPQTAEQALATIEKLFGFKFKEDLIPALGNEVAFSMPFDANDLGLGPSRRHSPKKEDEKAKESEAGAVVIVSLNDPDKIRKILPRVLVALGFVPFGDRASQAERREGFEINSAGGFVYSVIDRFLVVGADITAVRHVVDSYAARRTLASTNSYRDATGWQAPQKIVQAYVSEALMRSTVEETKRRSGESTDPLVRALLAQLEAPPEPASLETTNEGDAVVHELRVPVSMIQTYALSIAVSMRDMPVISGESSATYALYEVHNAEMSYKDEKKKERYGTLEELAAEKILDKGFAEHLGYRIELNASGEKFDVTATPKEYGKTGRLSFFLDETGTMRAADHKGKPATASDPPVD
ncbi:MAG TPA: DUF3352 domain-containing protein [Pyrinomonadaceae bacterium]|jgi:hypothetical protein|nr:DUF3352 domain-containing protein [Pyrinomonadaceae bacterium]